MKDALPRRVQGQATCGGLAVDDKKAKKSAFFGKA